MKRSILLGIFCFLLTIPAEAQSQYSSDDPGWYKETIYAQTPEEVFVLISLSWSWGGEDRQRPLRVGVEMGAFTSGYQAGLGITFGGTSGLGAYLPAAYLVALPVDDFYIPVRGMVGIGVNGDLWAGLYGGALYRELNQTVNPEAAFLLGVEAHTNLGCGSGGTLLGAEVLGAGVWVPEDSQWDTEYVYY